MADEKTENKDAKPADAAAAAPAAPATEAKAEGAAKSKALSPVILGGGVGALVLILGAIGWFFFGKSSPKDEKAPPAHEAANEAAHDAKGGGGGHGAEAKIAYYDIPDMLINLVSEPGRQNFLKIKITIEMFKSEDLSGFDMMKPRIIDQIQVYLRELKVSDLQGSQGIMHLREELLLRINSVTAPLKAKDILFRDLLVQ